MHLDEASEIQNIIEQREHHFKLELEEVHAKYEKIMNTYQVELTELKGKIEELETCKEEQSGVIKRYKEVSVRKEQQREEFCL